MARKEFVRLMEENIWILDKIADKAHMERAETADYSRQMMSILVRLHNGGRARLKDIARREHVSAPNLCAAFRKLEADGMVVRTIDENDRRNTWYCVSSAGADKACAAMNVFRNGIEHVFSSLTREDEARLTDALRTIRDVIKKVELNNEQN